MARKAGKSPAFQWYPNDAQNDEAVRLMNNREFGIYVKLLGLNWVEGSIPNDPKKLAKLVQEEQADFDQMWPQISVKFSVKNRWKTDRLTNNRLELEKLKQSDFRKKQSLNAKKAHHSTHGSSSVNQAKPQPKAAKPQPKSSQTTALLSSSSSSSSINKETAFQKVEKTAGETDRPRTLEEVVEKCSPRGLFRGPEFMLRGPFHPGAKMKL